MVTAVRGLHLRTCEGVPGNMLGRQNANRTSRHTVKSWKGTPHPKKVKGWTPPGKEPNFGHAAANRHVFRKDLPHPFRRPWA